MSSRIESGISPKISFIFLGVGAWGIEAPSQNESWLTGLSWVGVGGIILRFGRLGNWLLLPMEGRV